LLVSLLACVDSAHLPAPEVSAVQGRVAKQNSNLAREVADDDRPIGIVRSVFLPQTDGAFEYSFESENGIKQVTLKNIF
jgi:hypothetical protein